MTLAVSIHFPLRDMTPFPPTLTYRPSSDTSRTRTFQAALPHGHTRPSPDSATRACAGRVLDQGYPVNQPLATLFAYASDTAEATGPERLTLTVDHHMPVLPCKPCVEPYRPMVKRPAVMILRRQDVISDLWLTAHSGPSGAHSAQMRRAMPVLWSMSSSMNLRECHAPQPSASHISTGR